MFPVCVAYVYAGEARGADTAAWRQLMRAESAMLNKTHYGQLLLDLVNAFERIRHQHFAESCTRLC